MQESNSEFFFIYAHIMCTNDSNKRE